MAELIKIDPAFQELESAFSAIERKFGGSTSKLETDKSLSLARDKEETVEDAEIIEEQPDGTFDLDALIDQVKAELEE